VNWVPGDSKNLVRRLNGEFNLALGNELGVVHASYQFALFVHLFGETQLVENTEKEHPAYPSAFGAGIDDALYIEQQTLQRFSRARIGLWGIVPHPDA
jgi:hypothetical protein